MLTLVCPLRLGSGSSWGSSCGGGSSGGGLHLGWGAALALRFLLFSIVLEAGMVAHQRLLEILRVHYTANDPPELRIDGMPGLHTLL